jgi:hypothetical protein
MLEAHGEPLGRHPEPARGYSPTVRRRRLGVALRRLRVASAFTTYDAAQHIECSQAKMSKIEMGRVPVKSLEVKALLELYGVSGEQFESLLMLARQSQQRGWWQVHGNAVPDWFAPYLGLEAEAESLRLYEAAVVPGPLQTSDYARALAEASVRIPDEDIERVVALRLARQERLTAANPLQLWTVVDEAALRRPVGSPASRLAQYEHLLEMTARPNVHLQVLPTAVGAHSGLGGSFIVIGFPDQLDNDVVYLEHQAGALYLERKPEIEQYSMMFDQLRTEALGPGESAALVCRLIEELS